MNASPQSPAREWYEPARALARFLADAIVGELNVLRPGGATLERPPWSPDLAIGEDGLGLDSIERLAIASALSEMLQLHESGIEDLLLTRRYFGEWVEVAARGLEYHSARLVFRTSGSTGQPKPCMHAMADLEQEVNYLCGALAGTRRVLAAVPAHHIYGFLFTVLLPLRLGGIEVIDVRHITPSALPNMMASGDLVISHPAHWALVARYAGPLPDGVSGVTSTAHCPPELAQTLTAESGLQRLIQIYGSTETAGVGFRETAMPNFQLMPFWRRDDANPRHLMRRAIDGTQRSVTLQDQLEWVAPDHFTISARLDNAVQVAGVNVFPEHVREVLLQHPQVADAAVRLMKQHEGARLKAFVVPVAGAEPGRLVAELERWTTARLSAPERPKAFSFGEEVPVNGHAKLADWAA
ncbi:4-coumarate--CoA ligase [Paraburkholderia aromaticivorans]|uniref:4-coumarate--CoA ligase n=1 Tax=Paraburkholderia aromaticivorans TaxID=2026199 RepID=UPI0038BCAC80